MKEGNAHQTPKGDIFMEVRMDMNRTHALKAVAFTNFICNYGVFQTFGHFP